ncbi:MAG: hypothetical protein E7050_01590 [Lentisphaerae bacterium]|nr:hypothetical protein [Lentisphaerota bacterium]
MKQFKWYFSAILAVMTLLFSGCEIFREALEESYSSEDPSSEEFEARFNIGVFQIVKYPRAAVLEKIIDIGNGETLCVNTNALFSSKRIRAAKAVPRPGSPDLYDLEFRIDRMGKTQWMMLHGTVRGEEVVMMVDNRFVGTFTPEEYNDGTKDWVKIRIGVDAYTARGIVKFAKKNYDHYNPEASNWFSNLF